jgi:4'-phosphopantetheinyl transferase
MRPSPPAPVELPAAADVRLALGPRRPRLAPTELHVWLVDLAGVADSIAQLLDDKERERAHGIAAERDRILWARSRGLLRELLARYVRADARHVGADAGSVGADAGSLRIDALPGGKLVLADGRRGGQTLHFNVSHSTALAVYAFARTPVGVDAEAVPRSPARRDHVALARRAFGPTVADRLAGLNDRAQEREFLRLWTRHEAVLKLGGGGIGGGLGRTAADAWITELDLGAAAVAAAASERPAVVRVWSFG